MNINDATLIDAPLTLDASGHMPPSTPDVTRRELC